MADTRQLFLFTLHIANREKLKAFPGVVGNETESNNRKKKKKEREKSMELNVNEFS